MVRYGASCLMKNTKNKIMDWILVVMQMEWQTTYRRGGGYPVSSFNL
jgi:hypothetical protein